MKQVGFEFNKVFVIESLVEGVNTLTGKHLYDDLLRWKEYQLKGFHAEFIQVTGRQDFFREMKRISDSCVSNDFYPIIHFEVHGSEDRSGLVLNSEELVEWGEFYDSLVDINCRIGNNLFLTLAVCHGAYLLKTIHLDKPAPFWGFVGSFDIIGEGDLMCRYNEFYSAFLQDFDLNRAMESLKQANPGVPNSYKFINSEIAFTQVYKEYFQTKFSSEEIDRRADNALRKEGVVIKDRNEWVRFRELFRSKLMRTREQCFSDHKEVFFMLKEFPENRHRFDVDIGDLF